MRWFALWNWLSVGTGWHWPFRVACLGLPADWCGSAEGDPEEGEEPF